MLLNGFLDMLISILAAIFMFRPPYIIQAMNTTRLKGMILPYISNQTTYQVTYYGIYCFIGF